MTSAFVGSAGVIGWPVAHSKSPLIHRFWLERLGLDGDYGRFPVVPDQLGAAIRSLPALGLKGINVTVPHKQAVIPCLDHIDADARAIGAVNTVVVTAEGLIGYNSDVTGFAEPLAALGRTPRRVALIGAGGAARAALAALKQWPETSIVLLARREEQARALLDHFGIAGDVAPISGASLEGADLVVNASPLGMAGQPPLALPLDALGDGAVVYDLVYAPLETALLAEARARGMATIDGLAMLIGQAARAFFLFFGHDAPRDAAAEAELRARLIA